MEQIIPLLIIVLFASVLTIIYQNKDNIRKAKQVAIGKKVLRNVSKVVGAKIKPLKNGNIKVGKVEMSPQEFSIFYTQTLIAKGYVHDNEDSFVKKD